MFDLDTKGQPSSRSGISLSWRKLSNRTKYRFFAALALAFVAVVLVLAARNTTTSVTAPATVRTGTTAPMTPQVQPKSPVIATAPATVSTNSQDRALLTRPLMVSVHGRGFTVVFPSDGDPTERSELMGESALGETDYRSDILTNRARTKVCPSDFQKDPRCKGFVEELYTISIRPLHGLTAAQALDAMRAKIADTCRNIRITTFRGEQAIKAQFRTTDGGFGPYIFVVHNGKMYSIWANGLSGGAQFAQQFDRSFQFTT